MAWTIYWDNGIDCGTWGHLIFNTEEEAAEYAESCTKDYIADGTWGGEGSAEPYWLETESSPEENDSPIEQSIDYFDRYIAGDR